MNNLSTYINEKLHLNGNIDISMEQRIKETILIFTETIEKINLKRSDFRIIECNGNNVASDYDEVDSLSISTSKYKGNKTQQEKLIDNVIKELKKVFDYKIQKAHNSISGTPKIKIYFFEK